MRLFSILLCLTFGIPAARAATQRINTILHGPTVRLSDLFDGLQPGQDCDIGPAPTPGRRLVVPPAQLAAIAIQFGVDWHGGGFASTSIERPARLIRREEIIAVLRPALLSAGMPSSADVSLGVAASPTLPADDTAALTVTDLDYDPRTGRFAAVLQISQQQDDPQSMRVTGRTDQMVDALVLLHAVPAGASVGGADVEAARVRKPAGPATLLSDIASAAGLVTRQPIGAGSPLNADQLERPVLVTRGRPVILRLSSGNLVLTAAGMALEAGGDGDRIHVVNTATHAVLVGAVASASDILVDPGTAPTFPSRPGESGLLPRAGLDTRTSDLPLFDMTGAGGAR